MGTALAWLARARRAAVIAQIRLKAWAKGATVVIDIAPDVVFGSHFKVSILRGTTNHVVIERGCAFQDHVWIDLRGGSLRMGPQSSFRRGVIVELTGELILEGRNIISYFSVVHCTDRVRLGELTGIAELVTIVDSRHFHGGVESFLHNVESAPVEIGRNVWVSAKASVLMGVTIGDEAVVATHAVVHRDVPAGATVAGVPAKVIRQR